MESNLEGGPKYLYEARLTLTDINHDGKPDIIATGTGAGSRANIFTLLNNAEWPTTTPLITETSTTETSTTTITSSTTGTESSTSGTMFELVTGTTSTESSTTATEYPTTKPTKSIDGLSKENADLLARLEAMEVQMEGLQGTSSIAISSIALIVGTAALFFSLRSQKSSQIEKTTEHNIVTNNGFAGEVEVYSDLDGTRTPYIPNDGEAVMHVYEVPVAGGNPEYSET
jgi:hypothetical protein